MLYLRHRDLLPSMALSLLYFTVLSFGGQMVTYLLSVGYNSTQIGIIRTVSVVAEVSATWLGPVLMRRVGVIRAGLWSISWQLLCIAAAVTLFLAARQPIIAASGLITGVIGSRVGLWIFDLCVQNIVQEVRASSSSQILS
jgi:solute carrier family 40 (iron-regulated transporter), member 1